MVPGTDYALENLAEAQEKALEIGFPLLIKAAMGGGGKGMRVVRDATELKEQMPLAIGEAKAAFGDGSVLERYIEQPRHIEIQILADRQGNVLHLFERDCSIQRRHQKVVEESPAQGLKQETREALGKAAIAIAKACAYEGAGTVEFIMDKEQRFYFLEVNTRLQVEHPVTEMITGIDLVKEQIKIARGEKLSFTQDDSNSRTCHRIKGICRRSCKQLLTQYRESKYVFSSLRKRHKSG